jgi:hypothetical protein
VNDLSRRDLLRVSAGAALVAVPMVALAAPAAIAKADVDGFDPADAHADAHSIGAGPVMFCIHDAARGEVSILHGTSEVIVTDRRLVGRILAAARVRQDG